MASRPLSFHPLVTLFIAVTAALLYLVFVTLRFPGGDLSHHYAYVVPIVVPSVAFLIDRTERFREETLAQRAIDFLVVGIAMMRMAGYLPLISGHALFLTYALIRPGSVVTRLTACLLMLEVIYLKFFVWHDPISPVVGMLLALISAFVCIYQDFRSTARRSIKSTL